MSRHSRGKKTRISRPSFADRQGNWCLSNHFPYPGGPAACARLARLARIPRCPHCRRRGGVTTVAGLRTIWWNQATPNSSPGGAAELSPPLQRWESARTTQVPEGRPSSGPVPRVRVRSLNANLGGRNFARAFSKSGIPHCQEPRRSSQLFSSHFSRTLITDLHHTRCEDTSTVHHREVRQSPETNAFPASNLYVFFDNKWPRSASPQVHAK